MSFHFESSQWHISDKISIITLRVEQKAPHQSLWLKKRLYQVTSEHVCINI